MAGYQHKKGKICDSAIKALLSEPLFRMRTEKNIKGKGSYCRKNKHVKKRFQEGSDKESFITALLSGKSPSALLFL